LKNINNIEQQERLGGMNGDSVKGDDGCFVCGKENPVGLHVEFSVDSDNNRANADLTLGNNFQGWQGIIHGGIIATLLDEAAIYACRALSDGAVTAGMNVKYKKPVKVNCPLTLKAEVVSCKRRIAVVNSQLIVDLEIMAEAEVKVKLLANKEN
jgi:uncharacterized protein (TIGR00369 family)